MRTAEGASPLVHSGNALFTLLGFLGLYLLLGLLFLFLLAETIRQGPVPPAVHMSGLRIDEGANAH
jgi:cytochrome d ubiquinol oxidase subunit I